MKDEYKSEDNKTNLLINKFNEMLKSGTYLYFDSHEIEKIIDYFNLKIDGFKVKQAFNLYEKLYPFSSQISIKKAQTLILHDRPKEAFRLLNKFPKNCNNEEYLYTKACIYSKLEEHLKAIEIFEKLLYLDNNNEEILSNLANEYQKTNNYAKSADMLEKLINLKGMTQGMLVILGQKNIKKLSDFADLSSDELIGGFDEIKGKKIRIDGYLEEFSLSRKEADDLIMAAREIAYK